MTFWSMLYEVGKLLHNFEVYIAINNILTSEMSLQIFLWIFRTTFLSYEKWFDKWKDSKFNGNI